MTNEEAIETLKANYPDACFEQLREAVDMAIEVLKEQPEHDRKQCADSISRQDAIDALWENEVVRKKDLVDWIKNTASAYQQLQYLYRDRIDYGKEMTILCAVADYICCMKPYDGKVEE